MTPDPTVTQIAARLVEARRSGQQQPACEVTDAISAYAVQHAVARSLGWFPDGSAGHWKSGGASPHSVRTHAPLPPHGVLRHPADVRASHFHMRGIEAEIALRLRVPVNAQIAASLDEAAACVLIDSMCVAIEVVDSRWREAMDAPVWARLADLQSHGALVLGEWTAFRSGDWKHQACTVSIGTQATQHFQGTHALGSPTAVLPQWLRHATCAGTTVQAGTVVTTGTWCGLLQARRGDAVQVAFDGIGVAQVRF